MTRPVGSLKRSLPRKGPKETPATEAAFASLFLDPRLKQKQKQKLKVLRMNGFMRRELRKRREREELERLQEGEQRGEGFARAKEGSHQAAFFEQAVQEPGDDGGSRQPLALNEDENDMLFEVFFPSRPCTASPPTRMGPRRLAHK